MEYAANHPATSDVSTAGNAHVPLLELVTKSNCHLCEAARTVVAEVAGSLGLTWSELSIDNNPELIARYGEEIPVVLVDGIQRDFWHIDPARLRRLLS
ncbi:glutaredoxin family protein [Arthrobacter sp. TMP15]|uniref:glutaredoxin family protein n=1 Tax=Arthrobacter sp. TMP15 TaxID=3140789 RepID=UPI0031B9D713